MRGRSGNQIDSGKLGMESMYGSDVNEKVWEMKRDGTWL